MNLLTFILVTLAKVLPLDKVNFISPLDILVCSHLYVKELLEPDVFVSDKKTCMSFTEKFLVEPSELEP